MEANEWNHAAERYATANAAPLSEALRLTPDEHRALGHVVRLAYLAGAMAATGEALLVVKGV